MAILVFLSAIGLRVTPNSDVFPDLCEFFLLDQEFRDKTVEDHGPQPLYPGHIPTSALQKTILTAGSAFMSLFDPTRGRKYCQVIMICHQLSQ